MRIAAFFALIIAALPYCPVLASAETRVALVIGNSNYQHVSALPNPINDSADMAAALKRLGFDVRTLTDARYDDMRQALLEFDRRAAGSDIAVAFFAGHGMEVGGQNWLIPVDAELSTDTAAENEALSLRTVIEKVGKARQLGLVILDACRNNPFAAKMLMSTYKRAVERGFGRVEPFGNVLVAYAAKDGTTANDGRGRNSPFTAALLKNIETPNVEIEMMFRLVRDDVIRSTNGEQLPFKYGSLSGQGIYLQRATQNANAAAAPAPSIPTVDSVPAQVEAGLHPGPNLATNRPKSLREVSFTVAVNRAGIIRQDGKRVKKFTKALTLTSGVPLLRVSDDTVVLNDDDNARSAHFDLVCGDGIPTPKNIDGAEQQCSYVRKGNAYTVEYTNSRSTNDARLQFSWMGRVRISFLIEDLQCKLVSYEGSITQTESSKWKGLNGGMSWKENMISGSCNAIKR